MNERLMQFRIGMFVIVAGLVLSAGLGWWWADPTAGYVLVLYAAREARAILAGQH